jgi:hypothetical protein
MPSKYLERNLVKYGEAIRLYFDDQTGSRLNLWNFGEVFGLAATKPAEIVVGRAVLSLDKDQDKKWVVDIGSLLSVLDVIRFQRAVSVWLGKDPSNKVKVEGALKSGLQALGVRRANDVIQRDGSPVLTCRKTKKLIADELQAAQRLRPGWEQDAARELLGFVGWFPKPALIAQEERTLFNADNSGKPDGSGKTSNTDNRDLKPVLSTLPVPAKNALDQLIDELDEKLKQNESIPDQVELDRRLHAALDRVHAFAYRGDSRDPATVKAAFGLLPSFTRKAEGKFADQSFVGGATPGKVSDLAKVFDELRQSTKSRRKRRDNLAAYIDQFKAEKILDLAAYTGNEVFRGYLSTTKSTAIAKCFANAWVIPPKPGSSWCYAVRCNGGYETKSHVKGVAAGPDGKVVIDIAERKKLHEATNFLEQEIAMPGGIWWDQVVGFRLVDYSSDGQFLAGPVFLRETGYWKYKQDEAAFDALFEQLSGAGQGDDPTIRKSYKQASPGDPWDLVANNVD